MEKLPIDSEKYLGKVKKTNLETIPYDEIESSLTRLSEPFNSVVMTENGFDIDYEGVEINMEYKPYTYLREGESYTSMSMKVIDSFRIKTENTVFDLLSILPDGVRIIVQSDSEKETGHIIDIDGVDEISILGEINSLKMIVVLLHEIGHIIDMKKINDLGIKGYEADVRGLMDNKDNADIAEKIRKERTANAFALKILRPFLKKPEIRKDIINLLKYDALYSYYHSAKKELEKRNRKSSHFHYVSMDVEDFSGNEW